MSSKSLKDYKAGKFCESSCERKVITTDKGPVIVCDYCNRIVMDRRS